MRAAGARFVITKPGCFTESPVSYGGTVSIEQAKTLTVELERMDNDILLGAAFEGDQDARTELLIRHIMSVDNIEHAEAKAVVSAMSEENQRLLSLFKLPYKIGLFSAVTAGLVSIPLVFDLETAIWFNENFVTAEEAGEGETDTWLEVGSWTWNWMEPPLGELSFFLLTMQYARSQMMNLGWKPYGHWIQASRARKLVSKFPNYDERLVTQWAAADALPGAS